MKTTAVVLASVLLILGPAGEYRAHEVDCKDHNGDTNQIGLQLFGTVDLEPSRKINLLDE